MRYYNYAIADPKKIVVMLYDTDNFKATVFVLKPSEGLRNCLNTLYEKGKDKQIIDYINKNPSFVTSKFEIDYIISPNDIVHERIDKTREEETI